MASSFSILLRIVGDVTGCGINLREMMDHQFQYPLADRRRCNFLLPPTLDDLTACFSILLRIVGDVTVRDRQIEADLVSFSILLRIVGDVTTASLWTPWHGASCFSILLRIVGDVTF